MNSYSILGIYSANQTGPNEMTIFTQNKEYELFYKIQTAWTNSIKIKITYTYFTSFFPNYYVWHTNKL